MFDVLSANQCMYSKKRNKMTNAWNEHFVPGAAPITKKLESVPSAWGSLWPKLRVRKGPSSFPPSILYLVWFQ